MNKPAASLKQQLASQQLAALQAENRQLRSELEAWQNNVAAATPKPTESYADSVLRAQRDNWIPLVCAFLAFGWAALQWMLSSTAESAIQQQVFDTRIYGSLIVAAILYHKSKTHI